MKKSLLALALSSTFGLAAAQSSITMYGLLDAGISYSDANTAGALVKLDSGQSASSRFGFKGTEDLGGGLKINFQLEQGMGIDTGVLSQAGRVFGRHAWVGVSGNLGELNLGRHYIPIFSAYILLDPLSANSSGDINNLFGRDGDFNLKYLRADNAVMYKTPAGLNGFNASALYSFGEVSGETKKQSQAGLSLGYNNGPLLAIYAYHQANNELANNGASTEVYKAHLLGGTYQFDTFKLFAAFNQVDQGTNFKTQSYLVGATVPIGVHSLYFDYTNRQNTKVSDADAGQLALGFNYTLSKRTNLYTIIAYRQNDRFSSQDVSEAGRDFSKVQMGIKHTF